MSLMRWDPWGEMRTLRERMDRLFEEMMGRGGREESALSAWTPHVDIAEMQGEFVITADLPGMNKEDIAVEITGEALVLRGERKKEEVVKGDNFHRVERQYGRFQRSFTLGVPINADGVTATYTNGVLEVKVPKAEEVKPKQIAIGTGN